MALPTLAELLTVPTQQQVLDQEVFPELRLRTVRVTDWLVGGVYRAMAYVVAKMRVDDRQSIASVAAGYFGDYCFGFVSPPGGIDVTGWATLIAKQVYGVERILASYTRRTITLTNSAATPYGPIEAGGIIVVFPTGNRYVLDETVTIPASGAVDAVFRSEFANDSTQGLTYTDPSGSTIFLVTGIYPGVTATNPAPDYTDTAQAGTGLGTVTPSGTPTGSHSVVVRIDSGGQAATCTYSVSIDGGSFTQYTADATQTNLGGYGIDITLANNGGSPAFIEGDYYYFNTPGSDITEVGRDLETPQELGTRCRAVFPAVAWRRDAAGNVVPTSPTESGYVLLAKAASTQVKFASAEADPDVNNRVLIYVAGQGALLSPAVIAVVQAFLDSLNMITDDPLVVSPTTGTVTLGGAITVHVKPGYLTSAQQAMNTRLALYFAGVDPARPLNQPVNPLIEHDYVVSLITTTPGVTGFNDEALTLNGAVADLQLPVTPSAKEIAVWSQDVSTLFTWVTT